MFKCDAVCCSNYEKKVILIECRGFCNKAYHGVCVGMPRNWSESRLKDAIETNYICDSCVTSGDIVKNVSKDFINQMNSLHAKSEETVTRNSTCFEELTKEYAAYQQAFVKLDETVKSLETKQQTITDALAKLESSINSMQANSKVAANLNNDATETSVQDPVPSTSKGLTTHTLLEMLESSKKNELSREKKTPPLPTCGWRTIRNNKIWKNDWSDIERMMEIRQYNQKLKLNKKDCTRKGVVNQMEFNPSGFRYNSSEKSINHNNKRRSPKKKRKVRKQQKKYNLNKNPMDIDDLDAIINDFHNATRDNNTMFKKAVRFPRFSGTNSNSTTNNFNNFNRSISQRKTVAFQPTDNFEKNLPLAVHRNIKNYKEKYAKFVKGGIFQAGASTSNTGINNQGSISNISNPDNQINIIDLSESYVDESPMIHGLRPMAKLTHTYYPDDEIEADLIAYRSYLRSQRLSHLQNSERVFKKHYGTSSTNFH